MSAAKLDPTLADALAQLARRDFTRAALEQRLERKGHDAAAIRRACDRCRQYGYLDDRAFGLSRASGLIRRRPCGRIALLEDLRRQGLARTMSEQVVAEVYAEAGGEEAVLDQALRRWMDRHGEPADWRAAKRCADHLARRGFATAAVRAALSSWLDELGT